MNYPSIKTIETRLQCGRVKAKILRGLMDGTMSPDGFQSVQDWTRRCYNPPRRCEKVDRAIDEVLNGFGSEAIRGNVWVDSFCGYTIATYSNQGETYTCTIIRDTDTGRFTVTSYGDWVEAYERRTGRRIP
jgi:hypothetical protein